MMSRRTRLLPSRDLPPSHGLHLERRLRSLLALLPCFAAARCGLELLGGALPLLLLTAHLLSARRPSRPRRPPCLRIAHLRRILLLAVVIGWREGTIEAALRRGTPRRRVALSNVAVELPQEIGVRVLVDRADLYVYVCV